MSNTSADRDSMLDILKTNYVVSASQNVIAQWNHNRYNEPLVYGYYHSYSSDYTYANSNRVISNMYNIDTSEKSVTMNTNVPVSLATYSTNNATYPMDNIIRLMFDAKISNVSAGVVENMSDFMLKIVPSSLGTPLNDYEEYIPITLVEGIYKKQELLFAANYYDKDYLFDNIAASIVPVNDVYNGSVTVSVKNMAIAPVSRDEIEEFQFDNMRYIFTPNRAGDQILENSLINASYNPISKYFIMSNYFVDKKNSPDLIPTMVSPYNENVYFLGPRTQTIVDATASITTASNGHNFFVEYASVVPTNQIYIKTQNFPYQYLDMISKVDKIEVYAKIGSGGWGSTPIYSETTGSFINTGAIIIQYNGSTWDSGYNAATLPQINSITGSVTSPSYVNIKALHVVCYAPADEARIRMVEISPRLTLDLSNFVISTNIDNSIDDGNQWVPVGNPAISNGTISLENLPRWTNYSSESGSLYQIFDNNSISILNGLIKSDVKFTISTTITSESGTSASIKNATMYASEWSNKDIETAEVQLSDYGRIMQQAPSPDLLLTTAHTPLRAGTFQKAIEASLQLSGFSDYDIASASVVSKLLSSKIKASIPIFYCNKEKKIWDTLTELCSGYQVSAFFDENGILQFRDILREQSSYPSYSNGTKYYITSSAVNGYLPNIISFSHEIKPELGEANINYKVMSVTNNFYDGNGNIFPEEALQKMFIETKFFKAESNSPTVPFDPPENRALICANIVADINPWSTQISLGKFNHNDAGDARFISSFKGYGIIEGEIISWDGLKYSFTPITGFPTTEIIRSKDELADAVSQRFNYLNTVTKMTSVQLMSASLNCISASFSSAHQLLVNKTVALEIRAYDGRRQNYLYSGKGTVRAASATVAVFELPTPTTAILKNKKLYATPTSTPASMGFGWIPTDSIYSHANRGDLALTYNMTGTICNVRRGLFGTSARPHYSQAKYDSSAFIGYSSSTSGPVNMAKGITFYRNDQNNNNTNFPMPLRPNLITYLGFDGKDSNYYGHYKYVFTPNTDVDSFGIFFGASMVPSSRANTVQFKSTDGWFIEFFPTTDKGPWGVTVRKGVDPDGTLWYVSKQKILNDAWQHGRTKRVKVYVADGKYTDPTNNKKYNYVNKKIPAPVNTISVIMNLTNNSIREIRVNNKKVFFYPRSAIANDGKSIKRNSRSSRSQYMPLVRPNRRRTTFGVFSRNTDRLTSNINIQDIQAIHRGVFDHGSAWEDGGENSALANSIDNVLNDSVGNRGIKLRGVLGFSHAVKPFSLRAMPLLRGVEINDEKWQEDLPFYDLRSQNISGMVGKQIVPADATSKSIVLGTPFRGRWAYKNNIDEVVYTKANTETYIDEKIYGKSINVQSDRKLTRTVNSNPTLEKMEVSLNWSNGQDTAEQVLNSILKNVNIMNEIYNIEIYGNPALRVGDYVTLHYPESGIYERSCIVISAKNNFSDGGIATSLVLRNTHQ